MWQVYNDSVLVIWHICVISNRNILFTWSTDKYWLFYTRVCIEIMINMCLFECTVPCTSSVWLHAPGSWWIGVQAWRCYYSNGPEWSALVAWRDWTPQGTIPSHLRHTLSFIKSINSLIETLRTSIHHNTHNAHSAYFVMLLFTYLYCIYLYYTKHF